MFRPIFRFGALVALALVALSACAEDTPHRSGPPAPPPTLSDAPLAKPTSPMTTPPRSTPAPTPGKPGQPADDQSLRLGAGPAAGNDSCRVQCERSYNVCMDSVAARTQSGEDRPDRMGPFTGTDNCQYSLRRCYQRCGGTP